MGKSEFFMLDNSEEVSEEETAVPLTQRQENMNEARGVYANAFEKLAVKLTKEDSEGRVFSTADALQPMAEANNRLLDTETEKLAKEWVMMSEEESKIANDIITHIKGKFGSDKSAE